VLRLWSWCVSCLPVHPIKKNVPGGRRPLCLLFVKTLGINIVATIITNAIIQARIDFVFLTTVPANHHFTRFM
jgi:hypothetical protein